MFGTLLLPVTAWTIVAAFGALVGYASLEHALMDLRFSLLPRPASGDLVVVEIDSASLAALDSWPWPRQRHAEALDRLSQMGVRKVAFDIDFSARSTAAADAALAEAMARAVPDVVLPVFQQRPSGAAGNTARAPLPSLRRHAELASVNYQASRDGRLRLYAAFQPWADRFVPSLATALLAMDVPPNGEFYIDYGIQRDSIARVSFADLLAGRVDPGAFAGKTVLIGATALELGDRVSVPLHHSLPGAWAQAMAYESLVQGRTLLRSSQLLTWTVALIVVLAAARVLAGGRPAACLGIAIGGTAGLFLVSLAIQGYKPLSLDIAPAALALTLSAGLASARRLRGITSQVLQQSLALKQRSAMMRAVIRDSFDGIVIADRNDRVALVNPAAAAMLNCEPGGLMGRPIGSIIDLGPPAGDTAVPGGAPARRETSRRFETTLRRPDGSELPIELSCSRSTVAAASSRQRQAGAEDFVSIYTLRDNSARKAAEVAQRAALAEAVAASRQKTEFIAAMGHELRTPLNAIIGFSEMMAEQVLGPIGVPDYQAYARDIRDSGSRLLDIVNRILELARIEGGRYEIQDARVDLRAMVAEAQAALAPAAASKQLSVDSRLAEGPVLMHGDARAIQQTLACLLANAVKFTDAGGRIVIDGRRDGNGDYLIAIADNGIGIPPEQVEAIRRPFQQADMSHARKYEGLGLGLSLAAGFMELHGGAMNIASEPDRGTCVTLRFPAGRMLAA